MGSTVTKPKIKRAMYYVVSLIYATPGELRLSGATLQARLVDRAHGSHESLYGVALPHWPNILDPMHSDNRGARQYVRNTCKAQ
ncbi:hypothetical protein EHYA_08393 [Embleya hyalina]|uniref:Uncharacterized protein n=1 Tax=Embleya hyalina TaxID=516124 RepID=A0A401Z1G4_9ACTN|nr:hypothetical protein EHYA_08393 [Embleya hyalina]